MPLQVTVLVLSLAVVVLVGCSSVGSYAKSIGITDPTQLEGAKADYMAALAGFIKTKVLSADEGEMEFHSEVLRLNEGTKSSAYLEGYRRAVSGEISRFSTYRSQCSWIGLREDVQCKGQRFIGEQGGSRK